MTGGLYCQLSSVILHMCAWITGFNGKYALFCRRSAHEEQYTCKKCYTVFESADLKQLHEAEHMAAEIGIAETSSAGPDAASGILQESTAMECTAIITPDG